jgi:hypothetical protein
VKNLDMLNSIQLNSIQIQRMRMGNNAADPSGNNAAGPSGNNAGPSRKRKINSNSLKAKEKNARECDEYDTIVSLILRDKIQLTKTAARVIATGEDVGRKSVKTIDDLLRRAKNATPTIKCESQSCTGNALWGANHSPARPMRCEDHKKDGDVVVRCSECDTTSPLVSVGGKPMCLAHASIRVHEMPSESESIVDIRGKRECACGTQAKFGLTKKKRLACKKCAVVLGALMNVTFESIHPPRDHSKYTCAVDQCTKRGGYKTIVDSKYYCAAHRDALLGAENAANRSFGARAMFKHATHPCSGWPCSNAGCMVQAVVERRGTDAETGTTETGTTDRLCMEHWNEIPDDGVKESYMWTGTCYAHAKYGSCTNDIRGTLDRCATHKLPTDVDNANRRCITCVASIGWSDATRVEKNGDECKTCGGIKDTGWSPRFRENLALDAFCHRKCMPDLKSSGATIEREKRPPRYESDPAYRTDLAIDRGTRVEIIEIDEDAHGSRDQCNELRRLQAVVQWDARPVNVYRVNPDRPGFAISEKVTKAWVRENSNGRVVTRQYLDDDLEIPGVKRENLDRTVDLLEQAMFGLKKWENCVVYIDYPLDSEHLAPFLEKRDTEIIGESGGYADFVIVPRHTFFQ